MAIYSVIKNDGPGNVLIWQCVNEDFNNNSQLIVAESEEALFMKDGIVVQTFPAGKYTLNTANYPFIGALRKKLTGGTSPFSCKVYFINKAHALELYWGTDPAMQIDDPRFGIVTVGALGSYSIQVVDGKKFLTKLVGNNVAYFTSEQINKFFRSAFTSKIKSNLGRYLKQNNLTVLDLMTEYELIAEKLTPVLNETLDEYGVRLVNFYISGINIPEDDPSYLRIKDAASRKKRMNEYGDEYGRLTGEMLLENMSNSPAAGGAAGAGMGMGMGMAAGGMIGGIASQVFAPIGHSMQQGVQQPVQRGGGSRYAPQQISSDQVVCPSCGMSNPSTSKFCGGCGCKLEPKKIFCPNCGAEMTPGMKFCGECGHRRDT
jgi:membrane protease subunit (stomatin/prohibitin family)